MGWKAKIGQIKTMRLAVCLLVTLLGIMPTVVMAAHPANTVLQNLSSQRITRHNYLNVADDHADGSVRVSVDLPVRARVIPRIVEDETTFRDPAPDRPPPRIFLLRLKIGSSRASDPDALI